MPEQIGFPTVQGHCPACHRQSLFLGSGGYVTCTHIDCPEPDAASTLLEQKPSTTSITIDPVLPDLAIRRFGVVMPPCPEGRHNHHHPGDTCDDADAFITARDQLFAAALADVWLHGNGTGAALGLLPTTGSPPAEPTPEQRALDILRPHLATEPLYTEA
ncbi:DUF6085 family protein [Streptomyces sp. wa1063]|uniref:DUF6085 family protein n=1 Tax=Streptomyces sp. wa1063 TaxID=1828212 RepID=UPI000BF0B954|nr:DUF6085 family protein [Streptomyces sp. wa1063]